MKTFSANTGRYRQEWIIVDAEGVVLGRLHSIMRTSSARQAQSLLSHLTWIAATRHRHQLREIPGLTGKTA